MLLPLEPTTRYGTSDIADAVYLNDLFCAPSNPRLFLHPNKRHISTLAHGVASCRRGSHAKTAATSGTVTWGRADAPTHSLEASPQSWGKLTGSCSLTEDSPVGGMESMTRAGAPRLACSGVRMLPERVMSPGGALRLHMGTARNRIRLRRSCTRTYPRTLLQSSVRLVLSSHSSSFFIFAITALTTHQRPARSHLGLLATFRLSQTRTHNTTAVMSLKDGKSDM